jgi:hypothetical protein
MMHPEWTLMWTSLQERAKVEAKSYLEQLLSEGARKLLQAAIENEVAEYLQSQSGRRSEFGERSVIRNGHLPERDLVTGVGPVKIRQPRADSTTCRVRSMESTTFCTRCKTEGGVSGSFADWSVACQVLFNRFHTRELLFQTCGVPCQLAR